MTRRELALLLPLLALFVAAWAFFPERPDDEASYVVLAERLVDGYYVTGTTTRFSNADPGSPDLWFGPGLPALLTPLVAVDAPLSLLRLTSRPRSLRRGTADVRPRAGALGSRVGLAAAYALGLYVPFLGLLSNLHSEVLAVLFVVVGMLGTRAVPRSRRGRVARGRRSRARRAGADAGRLRLGAHGCAPRAPRVVAVAAFTRAGRATVVLALALALCLPWLVYTYTKTETAFRVGQLGQPLALLDDVATRRGPR